MTLFADVDGVVRLPHLLRGELVLPPALTRARIEEAFAAADPAATVVRVDGGQAIREPPAGRYLLLPDVSGLDLVSWDGGPALAAAAEVPLDAVLAWLERAAVALFDAPETESALALLRELTPYPPGLLDAEIGAFVAGLAPTALRTMVDADLGHRGVPGSQYLDGWVAHDVEALPEPGVAAGTDVATRLAVVRHHDEPVGYALRAMPTRQLHITAGNSPLVPLLSTLRLLLSKGIGVVKLASGGVLPGALLAHALAAADPGPAAPLLRELSIVYWPGGTARIEDPLLAPGAVDRIVVWGDIVAVASVRARAPMTRVVSYDPRYGVSLVGREAFASAAVLADVAARAAADVCLHDQKACNASHVQYVEGSEAQVAAYADALRAALRAWDDVVPPVGRPGLESELTMLRRGRLALADWYRSSADGWTSGVVVTRGAFDVLDHPLARFAVVRPVASLERDALPALSRHVSSVGVWPESRRLALRTAIAVRGVSSVLPLGRAEHTAPGSPHDGMLALSQLVDWARG